MWCSVELQFECCMVTDQMLQTSIQQATIAMFKFRRQNEVMQYVHLKLVKILRCVKNMTKTYVSVNVA